MIRSLHHVPGLPIGLERLTAQVLGLRNIREAVLYPRDRYRVTLEK
jgi:nondiscriminating aspartyl-tRNA synthetase